MTTVSAIPAPASGWLGVIRAVSRPSRLAFGVASLAVLSGLVTYATLTGLVPYNPTPGGLVGLLLVNLTLGLSLGALVAWRLVRIWSERPPGREAACSPGRDVQCHRRGACDPCRDLCRGDAQSRYRILVLGAGEDGARQCRGCGAAICDRAGARHYARCRRDGRWHPARPLAVRRRPSRESRADGREARDHDE